MSHAGVTVRAAQDNSIVVRTTFNVRVRSTSPGVAGPLATLIARENKASVMPVRFIVLEDGMALVLCAVISWRCLSSDGRARGEPKPQCDRSLI